MRAAPLVLVVDDHKDSAVLAARLLALSGFETLTATSAQEGLDIAKWRRIDVLLTDIELGDRSGNELLEEILRLYPVKAVAITGWSDGEVADVRQQSNFEEWLTKPVTGPQLVAAVTRLSGRPTTG